MLCRASFTRVLISAAMLLGAVNAEANSTLTYQGQLFGAHGAINATHDMTFRLYTDAEGGEAIWSEAYANGLMTHIGVQDRSDAETSAVTWGNKDTAGASRGVWSASWVYVR